MQLWQFIENLSHYRTTAFAPNFENEGCLTILLMLDVFAGSIGVTFGVGKARGTGPGAGVGSGLGVGAIKWIGCGVCVTGGKMRCV